MKGSADCSAPNRSPASSIFSFAARNRDSFSAIRRFASSSNGSSRGTLATGIRRFSDQLGEPFVLLNDEIGTKRRCAFDPVEHSDHGLNLLDLVIRSDKEPRRLGPYLRIHLRCDANQLPTVNVPTLAHDLEHASGVRHELTDLLIHNPEQGLVVRDACCSRPVHTPTFFP